MATSIICCCAPVFPSVFAGFKLPKALSSLSSLLSSLRQSKGSSGADTDRSNDRPWVPKNVSHPNLANTRVPESAANQMDGRLYDEYEVANTGQSYGGSWVPGNRAQPTFAWAQVPVVYQADGQPAHGYGFVTTDSRNGPGVMWVAMNFSQPDPAWTQAPAEYQPSGSPSDGYGIGPESQHMASNLVASTQVINSSYPMQVIHVPQDTQYR